MCICLKCNKIIQEQNNLETLIYNKSNFLYCHSFKHHFITIHITTTPTKASIQQVHTKGLPQLSTSFLTAAHEAFLHSFHSNTKQRMILSVICIVLPQLSAVVFETLKLEVASAQSTIPGPIQIFSILSCYGSGFHNWVYALRDVKESC